jgi:hypothetical protein
MKAQRLAPVSLTALTCLASALGARRSAATPHQAGSPAAASSPGGISLPYGSSPIA